MCFVNSLEHLLLRDLIGTSLDHDDLFSSRSYSQLQVTLVPLLLRRVDDQFAVDHTHLCHRAGTIKRDIRNAGSDRCA